MNTYCERAKIRHRWYNDTSSNNNKIIHGNERGRLHRQDCNMNGSLDKEPGAGNFTRD